VRLNRLVSYITGQWNRAECAIHMEMIMATDPKDPPAPTDVPRAPAAPQPEPLLPLPTEPTEPKPEIQFPVGKSSQIDRGDADPTGKPSRS